MITNDAMVPMTKHFMRRVDNLGTHQVVAVGYSEFYNYAEILDIHKIRLSKLSRRKENEDGRQITHNFCAFLWPGPNDGECLRHVLHDYRDKTLWECYADGRTGLISHDLWKTILSEIRHRKHFEPRPDVVKIMNAWYKRDLHSPR
jgi:hypothetical protein